MNTKMMETVSDEIPALVDSDVSTTHEQDDSDASSLESLYRPAKESGSKKLRWEFYGLTLWLELEEFESDITVAIEDFSSKYKTETIPKSHMTAIYGMTHLSIDEAKEKLRSVKEAIPSWPDFARPTGLVSDVAVPGRPGQVCNVAWCELTLSSNPEHERALDVLYSLYYDDSSGTKWNRHRPWKPHCSIAYDNPESSELNLCDMVQYVAQHPSLITRERKVEAISLWDTNGKMEDWKCLDRVYF